MRVRSISSKSELLIFFLLLKSYRANEIPNKDHKLESLHDNGILHTVCDHLRRIVQLKVTWSFEKNGAGVSFKAKFRWPFRQAEPHTHIGKEKEAQGYCS